MLFGLFIHTPRLSSTDPQPYSDNDRLTATVFQVPSTKRPKESNELLSMKWQINWRYYFSHFKIIPYIQLIPNPGFEEKLGDVWIDLRNLKFIKDGISIEAEPKPILSSTTPIVLTRSNFYRHDLISKEELSSKIGLNTDNFQKQVTVEVKVFIVKNTLEIIEEVKIDPPCTGLCDFSALLASSESESKERFCDVTLTVAQNEFEDESLPTQFKAYAHKAILATRSEVFKMMFSHNMQESATNEIQLSDIEPDVLKELLTYIYTWESPNIALHAASLLHHAEKHQLLHLKSLCERRLSYDLQIDNAARFLLLAHTYEAKRLKRNALLFIGKHGAVQCTPEWESVKKNLDLMDQVVQIMYEQTGFLGQ